MQDLIGSLPQTPTNIGVPFRTAEEAWFWFICAVEAREEGAIPSRAKAAVQRPCEPMDIYAPWNGCIGTGGSGLNI